MKEQQRQQHEREQARVKALVCYFATSCARMPCQSLLNAALQEEKVAAAMAREAAIKAHAEKLEEQVRACLCAFVVVSACSFGGCWHDVHSVVWSWRRSRRTASLTPTPACSRKGTPPSRTAVAWALRPGAGSSSKRDPRRSSSPWSRQATRLGLRCLACVLSALGLQVEENLARARNALLAFRTLRTRAPELQLQQQVQAEVKAAGSQSPGPEQPRTLVPMPTGGAAGSPGRPRTAGGAAGSPGRGSPGRGSPSRPGTAAAAAAAQAPGRAWNSGLRDDTDTTKQEVCDTLLLLLASDSHGGFVCCQDRHVLAAVRTIEMHRSRKIAHDRAVARSQSPLRAK